MEGNSKRKEALQKVDIRQQAVDSMGPEGQSRRRVHSARTTLRDQEEGRQHVSEPRQP